MEGNDKGGDGTMEKVKRPATAKRKLRESRVRSAISVLNEIRLSLVERMAEFITGKQGQLKAEAQGRDSYSFTLQQVEERFLNKIGTLDRALHVLGRMDVREVSTTFEAIEVKGSRIDIPQKLCDVLAEHSNAEVVDIIPMNLDDTHGELLVVLSTEERR